MGKIPAPFCRPCRESHRFNVMVRAYIRRVKGAGYGAIGWLCPLGHLALDRDALGGRVPSNPVGSRPGGMEGI